MTSPVVQTSTAPTMGRAELFAACVWTCEAGHLVTDVANATWSYTGVSCKLGRAVERLFMVAGAVWPALEARTERARIYLPPDYRNLLLCTRCRRDVPRVDHPNRFTVSPYRLRRCRPLPPPEVRTAVVAELRALHAATVRLEARGAAYRDNAQAVLERLERATAKVLYLLGAEAEA